MKVANWGKFPVVDVNVVSLSADHDAARQLLHSAGSMIARGMGRCYGDSALADTIVSTRPLNRILAFDERSGIVSCESGVTYAELLGAFAQDGWFPPVTPGTKHVTIGGAIASDVHGKNHHRDGCVSTAVLDFDLLLPSGDVVTCSRSSSPELFWATVGGMGLTGVILAARMRMLRVPSPYIAQRAIRCESLPELFAAFTAHSASTYSVAWIDTILSRRNRGRSVLLLGEHDANPVNPMERGVGRALARVPFNLPSRSLNRLTISAFNWAFYHRHPAGESFKSLHYEPYFYPLDILTDWNRIYGKAGFTQYQFVVPTEAATYVMPEVLSTCHDAGFSSFLSVLKAFGRAGEGLLSFPTEGFTLTLDLPIRGTLFRLLDRLDAIIVDAGGRVYLTKDVRLARETFDRMYQRADEFRQLRAEIDPSRKFQSLQSRRLGL